MAWLLLSLHLCWDPNIEPDLLGYWVQSAERHVVEWVVCPCEPGVPCPQHVMCPVYNSFAWEWTFTGYLTDFQRFDCANVPGSICYYKHPLAEDESGNLSEQPMLLFPPPVSGNCP